MREGKPLPELVPAWSLRPNQIICTLLLGSALFFPLTARAQELVSTERVEDWFYSRLIWACVLGAIFGGLIGTLHLARLRVYTNELHVNAQARRKFGIWTVVLLVLGALLLLIDIWLLYSFDTVSLSLTDALTRVWFNYRTILILLVAFTSFYLVVALTTRFMRTSRCPYAFLPGPRGR